MRRAAARFPWVSMMDLLFGMFGAMIVLSVIVTQKLGAQSTGIEAARPFHALTVNIVSSEEAVRDALSRMQIAVSLKGDEGDPCILSRANQRCDAFSGLRFATGAGQDGLGVTLLIDDAAAGADGAITVTPLLRDIAQLRDGPERDAPLTIRISVKTGTVAPSEVTLQHTVREILDAATQDRNFAVPLTALDSLACEGPAGQDCINLSLDQGGGIVFR